MRKFINKHFTGIYIFIELLLFIAVVAVVCIMR